MKRLLSCCVLPTGALRALVKLTYFVLSSEKSNNRKKQNGEYLTLNVFIVVGLGCSSTLARG